MKNNKLYALSLLAVFLALAAFVSVMFGGSKMKAAEVVQGLLNYGGTGTIPAILWNIRLPRIFLGILVGMGLSASGCVFQALLRNPLADPYTLGISGGAAFGAMAGIVAGIPAVSVLLLPLCAFAGALLCVVLVYLIAARKDFSLSTLILGGVILGFLFSSLVLLLCAVSDARKVHSAILWLMGDLSSPEIGLLKTIAVFVVGGIALLAFFGRELDILTLGDEKASHLGVETKPVKKSLFLAASLVTAACVSGAGIIGFVGLIIPHALRRVVGPEHRVLIPASALAGGAFLVLCDTAARTIMAPAELPVGVITGLIGGIFFLVFLFKSQNRVF